jgi:GNAT superfamily N-acetyltransferase
MTITAHEARPDPATARRLLVALPDWFGIPESVEEYVAAAGRMRTVLAHADGRANPIGLLLLDTHFPTSVEVHLMAVDPEWHRREAGRALLVEAERLVRADDARLLSVKTLGPARPDAGYARTREFYLAMGFEPLEELLDLWPGNPCLVMVKPLN